MAESLASGVATPLTSLLLEPLVRRVSYVVKVGEKVKDLEVKMADLNNLSSDIRREVEEAEKWDQTRRRTELLNGWLVRVPLMAKEVSGIKIKYEKLGRWCFGRCSGDIISMYKIGRNATRKLAEVTDLYQKLDEAKKSGSLTQGVPPEQHASYMVSMEENVKDLVAKMADLDKLSSDIRIQVEEAEEWDQTQRRTQLVGGWLERVPIMANEVSDITTRYQQLGSCSGHTITIYKRNATRKLAEVLDLYQKLDEAKNSGSLTQAVLLEQRVTYMVSIEENVKDLVAKMAELDMLSNDIRIEVEEVEKWDRTQRRTQLVGGWLDRVPAIANEVSDITTQHQTLGNCSGAIITVFKRNATGKLAEVKDLYQKLDDAKKNGSLTQKVPSSAGQEMPDTPNLIATESNLSKVLSYLYDGVGVVGIYGMGGVGKTTLLKSINNSILSLNNVNSSSGGAAAGGGRDETRVHFHHVILVTVSRDGAKVQRLQDLIAKELKLTFTNDDRNSWSNKIFNSLRNKSFVLLLDDVWERLDLNAIGIPNVGKGCVVVFTTRSENVCGEMEAERKVKVEVLTPEDAWRLFQENAKNEYIKSDSEIRKLARQIAEECKGLPLALITIGRAMYTKKTIGEWRHALESLKKSKLAAAISDANADMIMAPLKFSYDNLMDDKTRDCFLCCALFPEDHRITKEELVECLLGHGVIDPRDYSDIGKIYDYGDTLIGYLRSACLLESIQSVYGEEYIKMHDIIRDMALWIANDCKKNNNKWIVHAGLQSEEPLRKFHNWELANRISLMLNKMKTLPEPKQSCPNLSTLMIQKNSDLERIPETFFRHFPALTYLDLSRTGIKIFPEEVTMLVQLQYLNLSHTDIGSLSLGLRNLTKLKYLILDSCDWLEDIPKESISSLPSLQILGLYGSIRFDLSIVDTKVEELKRLKGGIKALGLCVMLREFSSLDECVDRETIYKLSVTGSPSDAPVQDTLMVGENIDILWLDKFDSLQELTMKSDDQDGQPPRLRELMLQDLSRLEKIIWKRPTTLEPFPQLTTIWIKSCRMRGISWIRQVTRLMFLTIGHCDELSDIIITDENYQESHRTQDDCTPPITFSYLRRITLSRLPRLHNIYEGTIFCPLLQDLTVEGCEDLTRLPFNFESHTTDNRPLRIIATTEWWETLKWEDNNIKSQLQCFVTRRRRSPRL